MGLQHFVALRVSVCARRDVHNGDNDNMAVVRTSEVGVTVVRYLGNTEIFIASVAQENRLRFLI